MWSMAASRSSTTAIERVSPRNSEAKSSSVAVPIPTRMARVASSPRSSTPSSARATRGRKVGATSRWTTRDSAALQTPGRWVLALTTIDSAMSRSAAASTYTWQLPIPSITKGTVACSAIEAISDGPPRGMRQSM